MHMACAWVLVGLVASLEGEAKLAWLGGLIQP
jgi:hypothetical protein